MFNGKKLLSLLLAGALSISSMFVTTAFAAEDEEKIEMTFDGLYSMDDPVEYEFLKTENEFEIQEKIDERILKAAGVSEISDLTYGKLAKVTSLDLSNLGLIDVPYCINYMVNMTRLNLSSNLLRSDALKELSLIGCTKLSNINLSDNYLTTMPSWFVADRVTSGNITKNFVDSTNPRGIKALVTTYYLMHGETLNENDLKNQILKSIRLNDGKPLPEIFFEYNNSSNPPYPVGDGDEYPYDLKIDESTWETLTVPESEDSDVTKVNAPQNKTIEVTVRLFNEEDNDHTKTIVTIYLLTGKDLPSLKLRLDGMVKESDALSKDNYTENSWTKFTQANDTAKAILKYDKADVQMLTNALDALSKARDRLVYGIKDLKNMIDGLVTVGGTYKQEDYTPASWERFNDALEKMKQLQSDPNARLEEAQAAVKRFQSAQAGLTIAELSVPESIPKSEFEEIFGENRSIEASGVTVEGAKYKWTFNGRDLETLADFNPEVKITDAAEPDILLEAGSKSAYKLFATVANDELPGKATLELDVSDKFMLGSFYLYKWDSGAKRSAMVGSSTVTVNDGIVRIPLTEGGVYYLCSKIQNFQLESNRYKVDTEAKRVYVPLIKGLSVSSFRNGFTFGEYTTVRDKDGNPVPSRELLKSDMTINALNMENYSLVYLGDCDGDGQVTRQDVVKMLGSYLRGIGADLAVCDVNGDGAFELKDVVELLKFSMLN